MIAWTRNGIRIAETTPEGDIRVIVPGPDADLLLGWARDGVPALKSEAHGGQIVEVRSLRQRDDPGFWLAVQAEAEAEGLVHDASPSPEALIEKAARLLGGKGGAQGDEDEAPEAPSKPPKRAQKLDTDPLAPGAGRPPPGGDPRADRGDVSPTTDSKAHSNELERLQGRIEEIHEKLREVEHLCSGETVPMFNALKADMRRLHGDPHPKQVGHLETKVEAFRRYVARLVAGAHKHSVGRKRKAAAKSARALLKAIQTELGPPQWPNRAEHPFVGVVTLPGGLVVNVETEAGGTRSGTDPDGHEWSVVMPAHYGEIAGTLGTDGEPLDVFVGEDLAAAHVYAIAVVDPNTGLHDEDKLFVGFPTRSDAEACFRAAYDRRDLKLGVRKLTVPEFQTWVADHRNHGRRIDEGSGMAKAKGAGCDAVDKRMSKASAECCKECAKCKTGRGTCSCGDKCSCEKCGGMKRAGRALAAAASLRKAAAGDTPSPDMGGRLAAAVAAVGGDLQVCDWDSRVVVAECGTSASLLGFRYDDDASGISLGPPVPMQRTTSYELVKGERVMCRRYSPLVAPLQKGGPYIGPKGGKWADPDHKVAWKEGGAPAGGTHDERGEHYKVLVPGLSEAVAHHHAQQASHKSAAATLNAKGGTGTAIASVHDVAAKAHGDAAEAHRSAMIKPDPKALNTARDKSDLAHHMNAAVEAIHDNATKTGTHPFPPPKPVDVEARTAEASKHKAAAAESRKDKAFSTMEARQAAKEKFRAGYRAAAEVHGHHAAYHDAMAAHHEAAIKGDHEAAAAHLKEAKHRRETANAVHTKARPNDTWGKLKSSPYEGDVEAKKSAREARADAPADFAAALTRSGRSGDALGGMMRALEGVKPPAPAALPPQGDGVPVDRPIPRGPTSRHAAFVAALVAGAAPLATPAKPPIKR